MKGFQKHIRTYFSNIKEEAIINNIGTVIGAYSSPDSIEFFFKRRERK